MSKGAQIALGALVIAALLGWYGYTTLAGGGTYRYYKTLDEFRADSPEIGSGSLRLHGYVALDSIDRNVPERRVAFRVQNDPPHRVGASADTVQVLYGSLETPDLFKDGAEVVVEGHLEQRHGDTVLVADNVMAKCPSKFQARAEAEASQAL